MPILLKFGLIKRTEKLWSKFLGKSLYINIIYIIYIFYIYIFFIYIYKNIYIKNVCVIV